MILESRNSVKRMVASGGRSADMQLGNLNQTERIAANEFTHVTPKNFNRLLNTHIDELDKAGTSVRATTMGQVSSELIKEESMRTTASGATREGRTSKSNIDKMFENMRDESKMTQSQRETTQAFYNKMKTAGFNDNEIVDMQRSHTYNLVRNLEDENFKINGKRQLVPGDENILRRLTMSPQYKYDTLSNETANEIASVQRKNRPAGELSFENGDYVTDRQVNRLKAKTRIYKNIDTDNLTPEIFNNNLKNGVYSNAELNKFSKVMGIDVENLRPREEFTTNMLGQRTSKIVNPNVPDEMLATLKQSAIHQRNMYEEAKETKNLLKTNKVEYKHPSQSYLETKHAGINQASNIEEAKRNVKLISDYDANDVLSAKTSNRMTRLINRNAESLKGFEIPVADQTLRNTLGLKEGQQLNLVEALNTPQYQRLQRGGLPELTKMTTSDAQIALRGNVANRALIEDASLLKNVTNNMDVGAKRLTGLASMTKFGEFFSKSPFLRGAGKVASVALGAIDPIILGTQAYDISRNLGASKGTSVAVGGGIAAVSGGVIAKAYADASKAAYSAAGVVKGAANAEQLASIKAATSTNAVKALTKVGGLGGGFALATTGAEILLQKTEASKKIKDDQRTYSDELDNTKSLTDAQRKELVTGSKLSSMSDQQQGGYEGLMKNAIPKALLIGGGIAATVAGVMTGGAALPLLGMAMASIGTT